LTSVLSTGKPTRTKGPLTMVDKSLIYAINSSANSLKFMQKKFLI